MNDCPACVAKAVTAGVSREAIPIFQNRVYDSAADAVAAPRGAFELFVCRACGFAYNSRYDGSLVTYDDEYDNSVPSAVFARYYRSVGEYLANRYDLGEGIVFDIGCGKGTFLRSLCEQLPHVTGVGVDPSYQGDARPADCPNLTFVHDVFRREHVRERPALLLCRHVLEHIENPLSFLRSIRESITRYGSVPLFVEVPDLVWILKNHAFWDFCYEHCNYFTRESARLLLQRCGYAVTATRDAFAGQYMWIAADDVYPPVRTSTRDAPPVEELLEAYRSEESARAARIRELIHTQRRSGRLIVVWGMATKGVMFANLVDPKRHLIDACVDINRRKQGKYIALTGHLIAAPESLGSLAGRKALVVVMNPNYIDEIKAETQRLRLDAMHIDASGKPL